MKGMITSKVAHFIYGILFSIALFVIFYFTRIKWTWEVDTGDLFSIILVFFASLFFPGLLSKSMYHFKHKREYFDATVIEVTNQMSSLQELAETVCADDHGDQDKNKSALAIPIRRLGNLIKNLSDLNSNPKCNRY